MVLLKHKFIKSKEEYKAEEHARYIEEVLANILDRLETYLAGNVFGRKEIINGERKMERKKGEKNKQEKTPKQKGEKKGGERESYPLT